VDNLVNVLNATAECLAR